MLDQIQNESILLVPIHASNQYFEFQLNETPDGRTLTRHTIDRSAIKDWNLAINFHDGSNAERTLPAHLQDLIVLDSRAPDASRSLKHVGDPYFDVLGPLLRYLNIDHTYWTTQSSESIAEHASTIKKSSTVIILGGDTSVHEFVNSLPRTSPKLRNDDTDSPNGAELRLLVIPTGTGNALATSVGLETPVAAIRKLFVSSSTDFVPLSSIPMQFPKGSQSQLHGKSINAELGDQYALVVASWGFHSSLVADSDSQEMRRRFKDNPNEKFKEAARINLETILQAYKGETQVFSSDKSAWEHVYGPEHSYLLFTLTSYLEAGFLISPNSQPPSESRIHMVGIPVFKSIEDQRQQLMDIMMSVYNQGSHLDNPLVTYEALNGTVQVTVSPNQPENMRRWCVDGKIIVSAEGVVHLGKPVQEVQGWKLRTLTAK